MSRFGHLMVRKPVGRPEPAGGESGLDADREDDDDRGTIGGLAAVMSGTDPLRAITAAALSTVTAPRHSSDEGRLAPQVVARRRPPRDYYLRRLLAAGDGLALAAAGPAAMLISPGVFPARFVPWVMATLPVWIVLFNAYDLYGHDIKRISHSTLDELPRLFHAFVVGTFGLWFYLHAVPVGQVGLSGPIIFGGAAVSLVIALRVAARTFRYRILGPERILLLGDGPTVESLSGRLGDAHKYSVRPRKELGDIAEVSAVLSAQPIDRVILPVGAADVAELSELLQVCKQLSIKVDLVPAMFELMGPSVEVDSIGGIMLLGFNPPVLGRSSRALKRSLDIFGAVCGLVLTSWLLILAAVAIRLTSGSPILFRQRRVGKDGRRFILFKLRTMCVDAEHMRTALLEQSRDPNWLLLDQDPRVTAIGRILRRTSIDELPQLWNVLRGDMSLVGPRPLMDEDDLRVSGWSRDRLDLTPGITGLWQVLGRTEIPFAEMIKLDYVYVTNWSLWMDIRLILRTVPALFRRQGAN